MFDDLELKQLGWRTASYSLVAGGKWIGLCALIPELPNTDAHGRRLCGYIVSCPVRRFLPLAYGAESTMGITRIGLVLSRGVLSSWIA